MRKHLRLSISIFVVGLGIVLLLLDAPSTCACMKRMGNWKTGEVRLVTSGEENKLWEALLFNLIYGDPKKIHLDPKKNLPSEVEPINDLVLEMNLMQENPNQLVFKKVHLNGITFSIPETWKGIPMDNGTGAIFRDNSELVSLLVYSQKPSCFPNTSDYLKYLNNRYPKYDIQSKNLEIESVKTLTAQYKSISETNQPELNYIRMYKGEVNDYFILIILRGPMQGADTFTQKVLDAVQLQETVQTFVVESECIKL